jgi:hypothetical protein
MTRTLCVAGSLAVAGVLAGGPAPVSAAQSVGENFRPDRGCSHGTTYYADSVIPSPGVITSLRFSTGSSGLAGFRFKVGRVVQADTIKTVAQSAPENLPASTPTALEARVPVQGGERLGFYFTGAAGQDHFCAGFSSGRTFFELVGDQQPGTTAFYRSGAHFRFPVSALVEADSDGDGFGDESQDGCPANAAVQGACPPPPSPPAPCPPGNSDGVRCQTGGGVTTIRGTPGRDRIVGTAGRDVVLCGDGADTVATGAGDDEVRCGAGADTIDTGVGNDLVLGELGNDRLLAGPGNDRLLGGDDQDRLSGGSGKDTGSGGNGRDIVGGGSGNDKLNGDAGADRVSGDSGNDSVKGSSGNDRLFGGSGGDRLSGGSGRDRLAGGTGRDKLAGGPGADKTRQ